MTQSTSYHLLYHLLYQLSDSVAAFPWTHSDLDHALEWFDPIVAEPFDNTTSPVNSPNQHTGAGSVINVNNGGGNHDVLGTNSCKLLSYLLHSLPTIQPALRPLNSKHATVPATNSTFPSTPSDKKRARNMNGYQSHASSHSATLSGQYQSSSKKRKRNDFFLKQVIFHSIRINFVMKKQQKRSEIKQLANDDNECNTSPSASIPATYKNIRKDFSTNKPDDDNKNCPISAYLKEQEQNPSQSNVMNQWPKHSSSTSTASITNAQEQVQHSNYSFSLLEDLCHTSEIRTLTHRLYEEVASFFQHRKESNSRKSINGSKRDEKSENDGGKFVNNTIKLKTRRHDSTGGDGSHDSVKGVEEYTNDSIKNAQIKNLHLSTKNFFLSYFMRSESIVNMAYASQFYNRLLELHLLDKKNKLISSQNKNYSDDKNQCHHNVSSLLYKLCAISKLNTNVLEVFALVLILSQYEFQTSFPRSTNCSEKSDPTSNLLCFKWNIIINNLVGGDGIDDPMNGIEQNEQQADVSKNHMRRLLCQVFLSSITTMDIASTLQGNSTNKHYMIACSSKTAYPHENLPLRQSLTSWSLPSPILCVLSARYFPIAVSYLSFLLETTIHRYCKEVEGVCYMPLGNFDHNMISCHRIHYYGTMNKCVARVKDLISYNKKLLNLWGQIMKLKYLSIQTDMKCKLSPVQQYRYSAAIKEIQNQIQNGIKEKLNDQE